MFSRIHIQFSAGLSLFFLFFLIVFSVLFSVWSYRKTIPPAPFWIRFLLIVLRSAVIMVALVLLFGPVCNLTSYKKEPTSVGLLLDASESMCVKDQGHSRLDLLNQILTSADLRSLGNRVHLKPYIFADSVVQFDGLPLDSSRANGTVTDISGAIRQVFEKESADNLKAVLLLSDGGHNRGEDPIRIGASLDFPVYSVSLGSPIQKPDLMVADIRTNEIVYIDSRVPVDVVICGPGYDGKRVTVTLKSTKQIVDQEVTTIPPDGLEKKIRFYFIPDREGFQRLTVEVAPLEDEVTCLNNKKEFYFKVLKSKMKVFCIGGAPGPDVGFLARLLKSDPNITLMLRTQKKDGNHFYEGVFPTENELKHVDVIFAVNFPGKYTSLPVWQSLTKCLKEQRIPFFFLLGKDSDCSKLKEIASLLPCRIPQRMEERLFGFRLTESGIHHPVLQVDENFTLNQSGWQQQPPLYSSWISEGVMSGSSVLAVGEEESERSQPSPFPLLFSRYSGNQKALVLLGSGIYRWDLLMWGTGGSNAVIKTFLGNAVRWLAIREEEKTVRLMTNKNIYSAGENIYFSAQVYDEIFHPVENARVHLSLIQPGSGLQVSFQMKDVGGGRYEKTSSLFVSGTFRTEVEAFLHDRSLGKDQVEFSVSEYNVEFTDTPAQPGLLASLSKITGGKSGPVDSLSTLLQAIDFPEETVQKTQEIEMLFLPRALLFIILLLGFEWFIRKRHGML